MHARPQFTVRIYVGGGWKFDERYQPISIRDEVARFQAVFGRKILFIDPNPAVVAGLRYKRGSGKERRISSRSSRISKRSLTTSIAPPMHSGRCHIFSAMRSSDERPIMAVSDVKLLGRAKTAIVCQDKLGDAYLEWAKCFGRTVDHDPGDVPPMPTAPGAIVFKTAAGHGDMKYPGRISVVSGQL